MKKKKAKTEEFADTWDLSKGMGILPEDISFTQNIGCVGGNTKKPSQEVRKPENKD